MILGEHAVVQIHTGAVFTDDDIVLHVLKILVDLQDVWVIQYL